LGHGVCSHKLLVAKLSVTIDDGDLPTTTIGARGAVAVTAVAVIFGELEKWAGPSKRHDLQSECSRL